VVLGVALQHQCPAYGRDNGQSEHHLSHQKPALILVGAGLAAALIAQRLSAPPNPPDIVLLESGKVPFGVHTWSFHLSDLAESDMGWLEPLVAHRWEGQQVRFAKFDRRLGSAYASLTSASVLAAIAKLPNVTIRTAQAVATLNSDGVVLTDGSRLSSDCVIDARGFRPHPSLVLGHQKFVGLEVETTLPHQLDLPIIMDARVDQLDGYRFVYVLPLSPTRLLIEDTRYSDGDDLDEETLRRDISSYASAQGWAVSQVVRSERGILPIALAFDAAAFWSDQDADVAQVGMRAGLFHPTTGYSLPDAARVANIVAGHWPIGSRDLARLVRDHALTRARDQGFYRLLNRMLFRAARPDERARVLQRFYTLPEPLIERFYAGRTTLGDAARILVGKPPVSVTRALGCIFEAQVRPHQETT
jgi:lycopene beta-cyclase